MRPVGLYVERRSSLHALDPISKLVYAVCLALVPFVAGDLRVAFVVIVGNVVLLAIGRVLREGLLALAGVGFFLATLFVVQGMVYPGNVTPLVRIGPLVLYSEGLAYALWLTARFVNLTLSAFVLLFTTRPADLVDELVQAGLPPRAGYVLLSVLQIIPSMAARIAVIQDAQRSRGMETEGPVWVRVRAFLPVLGPLVISSLVAMQERALALEVRGFGALGPHTSYRLPWRHRLAWPVRLAAISALLMALVWRLAR